MLQLVWLHFSLLYCGMMATTPSVPAHWAWGFLKGSFKGSFQGSFKGSFKGS